MITSQVIAIAFFVTLAIAGAGAVFRGLEGFAITLSVVTIPWLLVTLGIMGALALGYRL